MAIYRKITFRNLLILFNFILSYIEMLSDNLLHSFVFLLEIKVRVYFGLVPVSSGHVV